MQKSTHQHPQRPFGRARPLERLCCEPPLAPSAPELRRAQCASDACIVNCAHPDLGAAEGCLSLVTHLATILIQPIWG